jgi:predicted DNA-binding WGR domain protein
VPPGILTFGVSPAVMNRPKVQSGLSRKSSGFATLKRLTRLRDDTAARSWMIALTSSCAARAACAPLGKAAATEFQRSELLSDSCRGISGVNRSELIDSPFELDRRPECVRLWRMSSASSYVQLLVLERRDPRANMARFYVLSLEPTLFGDMALVREWGRLGAQGRRRLDLFEAHAQASEALETWLTRKLRKGYRSRLGTAA